VVFASAWLALVLIGAAGRMFALAGVDLVEAALGTPPSGTSGRRSDGWSSC
jgi:hypothetical protein